MPAKYTPVKVTDEWALKRRLVLDMITQKEFFAICLMSYLEEDNDETRKVWDYLIKAYKEKAKQKPSKKVIKTI